MAVRVVHLYMGGKGHTRTISEFPIWYALFLYFHPTSLYPSFQFGMPCFYISIPPHCIQVSNLVCPVSIFSIPPHCIRVSNLVCLVSIFPSHLTVSEFPILYALFLYFRPTPLYPSFQFGMPCFYISIPPHCIRVSNLVCRSCFYISIPPHCIRVSNFVCPVSIFPSHLTVSEFPILYALFLYFRPTPLYPSFQFGMPCFYISIPPHCIRVSNLVCRSCFYISIPPHCIRVSNFVCPVSIFPSHPTVSEFPIWYALFLYFHPTPLYPSFQFCMPCFYISVPPHCIRVSNLVCRSCFYISIPPHCIRVSNFVCPVSIFPSHPTVSEFPIWYALFLYFHLTPLYPSFQFGMPCFYISIPPHCIRVSNLVCPVFYISVPPHCIRVSNLVCPVSIFPSHLTVSKFPNLVCPVSIFPSHLTVSEFPIWYALFLYFHPTSLYPSFQFGMPCFYISIPPHCIQVSNLVCPVSIFPSHLTVSEFPIWYALFLYFHPTSLYPSFQFCMPCFYISVPPHCIRVSNLVCPVSIFPSHLTVSEFPIWYAVAVSIFPSHPTVSEFPILYALFLYFRPTPLYPSFQFGMPCFYISIPPHCIRVSNFVCPVSIFPSHPTVSEFPIWYAVAVSIFPSHPTVSEFPILYALFLYFRPTPLYPSFQFGMPCFYISISPHCIQVSNLVCPVSIFPSHLTVSEFPIWYALFLYFRPTSLYPSFQFGMPCFYISIPPHCIQVSNLVCPVSIFPSHPTVSEFPILYALFLYFRPTPLYPSFQFGMPCFYISIPPHCIRVSNLVCRSCFYISIPPHCIRVSNFVCPVSIFPSHPTVSEFPIWYALFLYFHLTPLYPSFQFGMPCFYISIPPHCIRVSNLVCPVSIFPSHPTVSEFPILYALFLYFRPTPLYPSFQFGMPCFYISIPPHCIRVSNLVCRSCFYISIPPHCIRVSNFVCPVSIFPSHPTVSEFPIWYALFLYFHLTPLYPSFQFGMPCFYISIPPHCIRVSNLVCPVSIFPSHPTVL